MHQESRANRRMTLVLALAVLAAAVFPTKASADSWPLVAATKCWSMGGGAYLKARITPAGDGFYDTRYVIVINKVLNNVGNGTAFLRGTSVFWAGADAGKNSAAMWTGQNYFHLNKNTLVGQWKGIGHDKNFADGSLDTEYDAFPVTLTPVACNAIWQ